MQSQARSSPFPLPNDEPPVSWHFDRGVEALVFIDRTSNAKEQVSIGAWSRRVWESASFTLNGLRLMPSAPPVVHDALLRDPRWR